MIAHVDEIPYFGEHTQVTVLCHSCGWRQTDFIPAEGRKPGGWTFDIESESDLSVRVVRSSSCTVCIPELDLEVNPGSAATGFVTNMEGLLVRFVDIVKMVMKDIGDDEPIIAAHAPSFGTCWRRGRSIASRAFGPSRSFSSSS